MELNFGGVAGVRNLNRIFCAQYGASMAGPFGSAFFMLNPNNTTLKGGLGHFKS